MGLGLKPHSACVHDPLDNSLFPLSVGTSTTTKTEFLGELEWTIENISLTHLWNFLPQIVTTPGLDAFKRVLDRFLVEKSILGYDDCI